ncbi:unnamed protein product [Urochloa decumbens]|uniref:NAD-dependent epimerase/dehydratase domain-containing protein n=1 Tax=Urochloa decumbens TaxID=240449 RepID=A0ABC9AX02_9POAL
MAMASLPRVCVTGGGGFIASWLVKLLLSRGYAVHATVRNPDDPKNAFLMNLDGAADNLRLFRADVLDIDSLAAAFAGCEGVFHMASPVPGEKIADPEEEMMAPTVKGTVNVFDACSTMNVKKVILVSSLASVSFVPNWPEDKLIDESCWSNKEFCKENENWYGLAKTKSEEIALEYGKKNGIHVVTVLPGLVFGPLLQSAVLNTSSKVLVYMIQGGPDTMNNKFWPIVDVRDVSDAFLLVYEKAEPSARYICSLDQMDIVDMLDVMKSMYPNYAYVNKMVDVGPKVAITSEKLKDLGWIPRKLQETLADSVECYEKAGLLADVNGNSCRLPYFYRMNIDG